MARVLQEILPLMWILRWGWGGVGGGGSPEICSKGACSPLSERRQPGYTRRSLHGWICRFRVHTVQGSRLRLLGLGLSVVISGSGQPRWVDRCSVHCSGN